MKKHSLKPTILGFVLASSLLMTGAAFAQSTEPTTPPAPAQPDARLSANVNGKVEAKSDTTLTVGGRTISLTSATTFSRNGASIGSGDVKVGYQVNVVTTDNGQVAVSVDVLATD
ncbi:MAG: hypothetical protein JWM88_2276 [Verrucomicrobia bacterium]|nr:hypothetical protein [Verrucomicrobiota bacterium]